MRHHFLVFIMTIFAAIFSVQLFAQMPPDDDGDFPLAAVLQAITPKCTGLSVSPSTVTPGGTVTLTASCTNSPDAYEWRRDGILLAANSSATFSTLESGPPGSHTYSVVARRGNLLSQVVSTAVTVIGNNAPAVSITAPVNNTSATLGTTIQIVATATDIDGTITKVEFFDGITKLGEVLNAPHTFAWANPAQGTHTLTARATDNFGAQTVSAPVTVTITAAPPTAPNETPTARLSASGFPYIAPAAITLNLSLESGLVSGETVSRLRWFQNGALIETNSNPSGPVWTKLLSLGVSTYEFSAEILTSTNRLVLSNKTQIVVSPAAPAPASVCENEQTGANVPGTLPGMAEVSSGGGIGYSVPIALPPGIAGVSPNLAIAYSSQGNNGPLGMGWTVQGFSSIHRCPQTLYHDGVRGKINYDGDDRLCMDGTRLVPTATIAGSTEYKTEVDSYTRIIGYGPSTGHTYFQAWSKDGRILTFGNTTNSALHPSGSAFSSVIKSWALNRVEDRVGNYIDYTYSLDNGNLLPATISYTGNTSAGTAPFATVTFNYEDRTADDQTTVFDSKGAPSKLTKRLASITTKTGAVEVKKYKFAYSVSPRTSRTMLASMQECSADEITCFTATTFQPSATPTSASAFDDTSIRAFGPFDSSARQPFVGDFNGDGKSDILIQNFDLTWKLCLANSDGNSFTCQSVVLPELPLNDPVTMVPYHYLIEVGDFNGDGKIDVLIYPNSLGPDPIPGDGGLATPMDDLAHAKATAHGKPDSSGLHRIRPGSVTATRQQLLAAQTARAANPRQSPAPLARFITTQPNEWNLCLSTGSDFDCQTKTLFDPGLDNGGTLTSAVGDFNGDGRTDFLVYLQAISPVANGLQICVAGDTGFTCEAKPNLLPEFTYGDVQVGDFDGDGRSDLLVWSPANSNPAALSDQFKSCLSTSSGSSLTFSCQNTQIFHSRIRFGIATSDFNGDGISDLLFYPNTPTAPATQNYYVCLGRGDGTFTMPDGSRCSAWTPSYPETFDNRKHVIGDFNGDGRSDFLSFKKQGNDFDADQVCFSTGSRFNCEAVSITGRQRRLSEVNISGDFNGNGVTDIIFTAANGNPYRWGSDTGWQVGNTLYGPPDTVGTIKNGLQSEIKIEYRPLTDAAYYAKGGSATYPIIDIQSPFYVVSKLGNSNGAGGFYTTTYTYAGLQANVHGGGLGGFTSRTALDAEASLCAQNTTETNWIDRRIGVPKTSVKRYGPGVSAAGGTCVGGISIANTTNTWTYRTGTNAKIHENFLTKTIEQKWDLNGTPLPESVTDTSDFDSYGNAGTVSVSSDGFGKTTTNTFENTSSSWILGRLTSSVVTTTLPYISENQGNGRRKSSFTYNANNGQITSETVEPDRIGTSQYLKTEYTYDNFGNRTTTTVSGLGISRSSNVYYGVDGRFPISVQNAAGHTETRVYDARFGIATSMTGPNVLTTLATLDRMGRKFCETNADGTTTSSRWIAGGDGGTNGYYVETKTSAGTKTQQHFDFLNREVATKSLNFSGSFVATSYAYDYRGRKTAITKPYGNGSGTTNLEYDDLNRVTKEVGPGGTNNTTAYSGLTTTATRTVAGTTQTTTTKTNSRGEPIEITDPAGNVLKLQYDAHGNLENKTATAGGQSVITRINYNNRGQKTQINDPDTGITTYQYNSAGELTQQVDADNKTTSLAYDNLGRLIQRTEPGYSTTWTFDTLNGTVGGSPCGNKSIGKLCTVTSTQGNTSYTYDALSRLSTSSQSNTETNRAYSHGIEYDSASRVKRVRYPITGLTLENTYNAAGYLTTITEPANAGRVHWRANGRFDDGQISSMQYGADAYTSTRSYDALGRIASLQTQSATGTVQNASYSFDEIGNLKSRADSAPGFNLAPESFGYDSLNRLTSVSGGGGGNKTFGYDALGNLTSKSGVTGTWVYQANSHRLQTVGSISYQYNNGGDVTTITDTGSGGAHSNSTRSITLTAFHLPTQITRATTTATSTVEYGYDGSHTRIWEKRSTLGNPSASKLTSYVLAGSSPFFEEDRAGQGTATDPYRYTYKHYIGSPEGVIGMVVVTAPSTNNGTETRSDKSFHRDHLGSTVAISDETGTEYLGYDAWGQRRNPNGGDNANASALKSDRGFTGHEHIDDVGLINMNGRLYDPFTGRMLSADPLVQAPLWLQSYNRYSYVMNNPLSMTDPTGYSWWTRNRRAILGIAVAAFIGGFDFTALFNGNPLSWSAGANGGWGMIAGGFAAGGINGGNMESAVMGAFSAALFGMAGDISGAMGNELLGTVVVHASMGCLSAGMSGGSCEGGGAAAAFAVLAGPTVTKLAGGGDMAAVVAHAISGGIGARIAGGNFADGMTTGAFGYLFNQAVHREQVHTRTGADGRVVATVSVRAGLDLDAGMRETLLTLSERNNGSVVEVISGQRPQAQQDQLRAQGNPRAAEHSQHTHGVAADIVIRGMTQRQAAEAAYNSELFRRTNLYSNPNAGIHVDQLGTARLYFEDWRRVPR